MSIVRYAKRRDASEAPIVEGLRKLGYGVWLLDRPCDLLIHHPNWGTFTRTLEIKTAYGKKNPKARIDKRQAEQNAFIELTGCPRVTTLQEALDALRIVPR